MTKIYTDNDFMKHAEALRYVGIGKNLEKLPFYKDLFTLGDKGYVGYRFSRNQIEWARKRIIEGTTEWMPGPPGVTTISNIAADYKVGRQTVVYEIGYLEKNHPDLYKQAYAGQILHHVNERTEKSRPPEYVRLFDKNEIDELVSECLLNLTFSYSYALVVKLLLEEVARLRGFTNKIGGSSAFVKSLNSHRRKLSAEEFNELLIKFLQKKEVKND